MATVSRSIILIFWERLVCNLILLVTNASGRVHWSLSCRVHFGAFMSSSFAITFIFLGIY